MTFEWLLIKRECYCFTKTGLLIFLFLLSASFIVVIMWLPLFYAVNEPLDNADILVVEGWLDDRQLIEAMVIFDKSEYQVLITTGTALNQGYYLSEYKDWATLAKSSLLAMGMPDDQLISVPAVSVSQERTLNSAKALSKYLDSTEYRSLNIVSSGMHARRTWSVFQSVLGNKYKVGVISLDDRSYGIDAWWKSSKGVRDFISESIKLSYDIIVL